MNVDQAVALATNLSGRTGFADALEGGRTVVIVKTLADLVAANKPGNVAVADPALAPGTVWAAFPMLQFANDFTFYGAGVVTLKGSVRPGSNNILRSFTARGHEPGTKFSDPPKDVPPDIVWIDPVQRSDIWFDGVHITGPANDGGLDIASSLLSDTSSPCRVSMTNCTVEAVDKTMAVDSVYSRLSSGPKIFLSMVETTFRNCVQRCPRIGFNAVVDVYRCRFELGPDTGYAIGVFGGELVAVGNTFVGGDGRDAIRVSDGGVCFEHRNTFGTTNGVVQGADTQ